MRSTAQTVSAVQSLTPAAYTAAANGSGVDLRMYNANVVLVITGVFGGTGSPGATVKVQESSDDSTYTVVDDSDLDMETGSNGAGIALAASSVLRVGYTGAMRYVRIAITAVTGSSPSIPVSGILIRQNPKQLPTA